MRRHAKFALIALLLAQPALAQPAHAETTAQELAAALSKKEIKRIRQAPEKAIKRHVQDLMHATQTGRLTEEVVELRRQFDLAKIRGRFYREILVHDLDGDLQIDATEIETAKSRMGNSQKAELTAIMALGDLDVDGALSTEEVQRIVASQTAETYRGDDHRSKLMVFDDDGDGAVTPEEIGAVIRRLAGRETAANGEPSTPSRSVTKSYGAACAFPRPSERAEIILIGGYEGAYVSPVALAGVDRETTAATLVIEEGDAPVYIVAAANRGLVWRLEGAVKRVEAFVATPKNGVAGIDRGVVHFAESGKCIPERMSGRKTKRTLRGRDLLAERLGREIDHLIIRYEIGRLSAPGGVESLVEADSNTKVVQHGAARYLMTARGPVLLDTPRNALARLEDAMVRQYPGGVADLDAADVISTGEPTPYEVLPGSAGVLQLARQGKLQMLPDSYFRIVAPIPRFPANLAGAHSVKFILGKSIPMPAGDPAHSSVFLEATGECLSGKKCR